MVYIAVLEALKMTICLSQVAQLCNDYPVQVAVLQQNKSSIKILPKYVDYANMFLFDLVLELPKNIDINEYAI